MENKFFNLNYYRTKTNRLLFFVAADVVFILLAVWLSFFLRFDYNVPSQYFASIWRLFALSVFFIVPIFYLQGLYTFSWSFVSTKELLSLFKALTLSFAAMGVVIFLAGDFKIFMGFPRSVLLISYFLIFLFAGGIRLSKKISFSVFDGSKVGRERTLIVGAGDTGEQILRNILSSAGHPYFPVGFVDDSKIKQNVTIHGVKVLGKISQIPQIVKDNQISQLIIALPQIASKAVKESVELARKAGVQKIKIFPAFLEIIKENISLKNLRNVEIGELLGRDSISLNTNEISKLINGKVIMVTGAAGSIGSELSRQIARFLPSKLILLDQDETGIFNICQELQHEFSNLNLNYLIASIRDKGKINSIFKEFGPQIVFHAAAYKHVSLMEENPDEAVKNNIFGTKVLVKESLNYGVEKFIFISCLDEKTRILTKNGLKYFNEVKRGDKILSLNKSSQIEEDEIEEVVWQNFDGEMLQIKNRSIDMLVTNNHKMLLQLPNNRKLLVEESAKDAAERSVAFLPKGVWQGKNDEWFRLPKIKTDIRHPLNNSPSKVKTKDMLYLLGIFIGDGFLNNNYKREDGRKTNNFGSIFLDIPEKDKARKRTIKTLENMGIEYKCYKGKAGEHIYFSSRNLSEILSTCGRYAKNKTIPNWALEYSTNLLQNLLDGLIDSDGHRNKLTSISNNLMAKCGELAAKLELYFTVSIQKNKESFIGKRRIKSSIAYIGIFSRNKNRRILKKNYKKVQYKGIVWCVRVKRNRNFLAERNGKWWFTGNTDKAVNPTSVMGATKRACEMICQAYNQKNQTKFISVRFGNVLDSRGSVIPIFREQIRRGGPVEVTDPAMQRYFMLNSEACLLVLQAGAMGQGGEVFVLDMGKPIKILDLAREMIKLSGLEPDKDIAIIFKGIRPGEKMFEEILTAEEGTLATKNQKIFTAKIIIPDANQFIEKIEKLENILIIKNKYDLIKELKEIVPPYRG